MFGGEPRIADSHLFRRVEQAGLFAYVDQVMINSEDELVLRVFAKTPVGEYVLSYNVNAAHYMIFVKRGYKENGDDVYSGTMNWVEALDALMNPDRFTTDRLLDKIRASAAPAVEEDDD